MKLAKLEFLGFRKLSWTKNIEVFYNRNLDVFLFIKNNNFCINKIGISNLEKVENLNQKIKEILN